MLRGKIGKSRGGVISERNHPDCSADSKTQNQGGWDLKRIRFGKMGKETAGRVTTNLKFHLINSEAVSKLSIGSMEINVVCNRCFTAWH